MLPHIKVKYCIIYQILRNDCPNVHCKICEHKNYEIQIVCVNKTHVFLISNFRRVLYVVCFLLGNSPASEFYMSTFRNTLSVPSS